MKKTAKRVLAVMLSLVMTASCLVFAGAEKYTSCGGRCAYHPTIIVPGLGQSSNVVLDDDGNFVLDKDGKKASAFPAYIDAAAIAKKVLLPALLTVGTQKDCGFSDAFADAIELAFGINACDENAQTSPRVFTEKMPYPYSRYSEYEKEIVNTHVPFERSPTAIISIWRMSCTILSPW